MNGERPHLPFYTLRDMSWLVCVNTFQSEGIYLRPDETIRSIGNNSCIPVYLFLHSKKGGG